MRTPFHYEDNLQLEVGQFEQRTREVVLPAEIRTPFRPIDNIQLNRGEFYKRPKEEESLKYNVQKTEPIRYEDNIKLEGIHYNQKLAEIIPVGDRFPVKRPQNNLHNVNAPFTQRIVCNEVPKADRYPVKRYEDSFTLYTSNSDEVENSELAAGKTKEEIIQENLENFERVRPIKHPDNLQVSNGEFTKRPKEIDGVYLTGDRADIVVHPDNLKIEGSFDPNCRSISMSDFRGQGVGDRFEVHRHLDHLQLEGKLEILSSSGQDFKGGQPTQRTTLIKQPNNLKIEGVFYDFPGEKVIPKYERRVSKKPKDTLDTIFDQKMLKKEPQPVLITTNKENQKNSKKGVEKPAKVDIAKVKPDKKEKRKRRDSNYGMSGLMEFRKEFIDLNQCLEEDEDVEDQKPSPEIKLPPPPPLIPFERATIIRPRNNLAIEGDFEFYREASAPVPKTEKTFSIRHPCNLKCEGELFVQKNLQSAPKLERRPAPLKRKDSISAFLEGDLELPKTVADLRQRKNENTERLFKIEKNPPIIQSNNLYLTGDMDFYKKQLESKVEIVDGRRSPKNPQNHLELSGDFDFPQYKSIPVSVKGDRVKVIKRDTLKCGEGEFIGKTSKNEEYKDIRGEKAKFCPPHDTLALEGKIYFEESPKPKRKGPSWKYVDQQQTELLKPPVPQDNLKLEGDIEFQNCIDLYNQVQNGRKAEMIRPNDNLYNDGEFYYTREPGLDPKQFLQMTEKRTAFKYPGNLNLTIDPDVNQNEYVGHPRRYKDESHMHKLIGQKSPSLRPDDNLFLSNVPFTKKVIPAPPQLNCNIHKPVDNLRPNSDHLREKPEQVKFSKRFSISKPPDNLYVSSENFTQKDIKPPPLIIGDKFPIKKPIDNLKPFEGEFTQRIRAESLKMIGERFPTKRPENNLKLPEKSVEFTKRPMNDLYIVGDRFPVKKPENNLQIAHEYSTTNVGPNSEKNSDKNVGFGHRENFKNGYALGDRCPIVKPNNNLVVGEGNIEFYHKKEVVNQPFKNLRYDIVKHVDNLKVGEGQFYLKEEISQKKNKPQGQVEEKLLVNDNFDLEISNEIIPQEIPTRKIETCGLIKPHDNLTLEKGLFSQRQVDNGPKFGDRFPIMKHSDNLCLEGEHYYGHSEVNEKILNPTKSQTVPKPNDNLAIGEGEMEFYSEDKINNNNSMGIDDVNNLRYEMKRPVDNLVIEGEFYREVKNNEIEGITNNIERRFPLKQKGSLYPGGKLFIEKKNSIEMAHENVERTIPIFPQDQIKMEFFKENISQNDLATNFGKFPETMLQEQTV